METVNKYNIDKIISSRDLLNNVAIFKKRCKTSKVCAVVKANAYGLGDETIVNIIKNYVDFFAVANGEEAIRVRNYTSKPILVLGESNKYEIIDCIKNNISLSVSDKSKLLEILSIAKRLGLKAKIHFKINTGMNRLGFKNLDEFKKVYNKYYFSENLIYEGIFSHIYKSCDKEKTYKQKMIFDRFISSVRCEKLIKHIASTDVVLNYSDMNYDMCRIGIGLYNYSLKNEYGIKPVMQLRSHLVNIIKVKKRENIGYGEGFTASKNMTIGIIPIGYADGYSRGLSNNSQVIINGNYANIVGNICMDMCFVDITNVKSRLGDEVILLGNYMEKNINAHDLADKLNTIDYEILTNLNNARCNTIVI